MGDVGSTYLGGIICCLLLKSPNIESISLILLISSPLWLDALVCIFRRFIHNQNIFLPHKLHLYQRLVQGGISHGLVTLLYALCSICLFLFFTILGNRYLFLIGLVPIILGFWFEKKFAAPFKVK